MNWCAVPATAALALAAAMIAPSSVLANFDPGAKATGVCADASWTGTLVAPTVGEVQGDVRCYPPQVTRHAGGAAHTAAFGAPPNGTACTERATSSAVELGPVESGWRRVSYFDPNTQTSTTQKVPDAPSDVGYSPAVYSRNLSSLWGASETMGSHVLSVPWKLDGTYAAGACAGTWQPANGVACPGSQGTGCYPIPDAVPRDPLPFTPPPRATFAGYLDQAKARFTSTYDGGQVVSQWATGGFIPQTGEIVRVPVCFWVQDAHVAPSRMFSVVAPQPGDGPSLVVNYVVTATSDRLWWDFGDGSSDEQLNTDPAVHCAEKHTYFHVSADLYGSNHRHTPPPGVAWTFGDNEPGSDMEAVQVWRHIHFGVTAYYQQPDGTQVAAPLPVGADQDIWVAARPEWVLVGQVLPWAHLCLKPDCSDWRTGGR